MTRIEDENDRNWYQNHHDKNILNFFKGITPKGRDLIDAHGSLLLAIAREESMSLAPLGPQIPSERNLRRN